MCKIKGYYNITTDGRVFSNHSNKYLKLSPNMRGYLSVTLRMDDGTSKTHMVHRLVALTHIENLNNLPQVNHIDGDKNNNHVSNLEWVSNQENRDHAIANGLIPTTEFEKGSSLGSKNASAKLNELLVKKFRQMQLSFADFCKYGHNDTLNITKACYNQMMRSHTWKHVGI